MTHRSVTEITTLPLLQVPKCIPGPVSGQINLEKQKSRNSGSVMVLRIAIIGLMASASNVEILVFLANFWARN